MPARERTVTSFRDEDVIDLFSRLPDLLEPPGPGADDFRSVPEGIRAP